MMLDARGAGGSGGNSTSTGAPTLPRGATQSIAFRLTKNETASVATPSRIIFRLIGRRIVPPDCSAAEFTGRGRGAPERGFG